MMYLKKSSKILQGFLQISSNYSSGEHSMDFLRKSSVDYVKISFGDSIGKFKEIFEAFFKEIFKIIFRRLLKIFHHPWEIASETLESIG